MPLLPGLFPSNRGMDAPKEQRVMAPVGKTTTALLRSAEAGGSTLRPRLAPGASDTAPLRGALFVNSIGSQAPFIERSIGVHTTGFYPGLSRQSGCKRKSAPSGCCQRRFATNGLCLGTLSARNTEPLLFRQHARQDPQGHGSTRVAGVGMCRSGSPHLFGACILRHAIELARGQARVVPPRKGQSPPVMPRQAGIHMVRRRRRRVAGSTQITPITFSFSCSLFSCSRPGNALTAGKHRLLSAIRRHTSRGSSRVRLRGRSPASSGLAGD